MSLCQGWHVHPCPFPTRYVVHWAYNGAALWPSEYELCVRCTSCCHGFLSLEVDPEGLYVYWWKRLEA